MQVYIGGLGNEGARQPIERQFGQFGHIRSVFVARRPPGFAFVEFDSRRAAERAVAHMHGRCALPLGCLGMTTQ